MLLSDENTTFNAANQSVSASQFVYTEHVPGLLRCVALGGSPPPDVDLYVGQQDISSMLTLSRSPTVSHERGLRLVYYATELSTDRLRLTADDDGALVQCIVTVAGLPSSVTTAHLTVHCTYLLLSCLRSLRFSISFLYTVFLFG